jgi:hypothetical protein
MNSIIEKVNNNMIQLINGNFEYYEFNTNSTISNFYNVHAFYNNKNSAYNDNIRDNYIINILKNKNTNTNNLYNYILSLKPFTLENNKLIKSGILVNMNINMFKIKKIINLQYVKEFLQNKINIIIIIYSYNNDTILLSLISVDFSNIKNRSLYKNNISLLFKCINMYANTQYKIIFGEFNIELSKFLNYIINTDYHVIKYVPKKTNFILFNYNLYKDSDNIKNKTLNNDNINYKQLNLISNINGLKIVDKSSDHFELKYYSKNTKYKLHDNKHIFLLPVKFKHNIDTIKYVNYHFTITYSKHVNIMEYLELNTEIFYNDIIYTLRKSNMLNIIKVSYNKKEKNSIIYIISGIFEHSDYPAKQLIHFMDKSDNIYMIVFSDIILNILENNLVRYEYNGKYIYINKEFNCFQSNVETSNVNKKIEHFHIIL